MEVRQSEGQLRSRRYRIKTFSIKEPRSLAIALLLSTRDSTTTKNCIFDLTPSEKE